MFALVGFLAVFFQVDGDEDELEVGEEGLVEPVVAGGGPAVVLHAVEDAFDHVPPLVRHAPLKRPCSRPGSYQRSSGVPVPGDNTPPRIIDDRAEKSYRNRRPGPDHRDLPNMVMGRAILASWDGRPRITLPEAQVTSNAAGDSCTAR